MRLLPALIVAASLAGCGPSNDPQAGPAENRAEPASRPAAAATPAADNALDPPAPGEPGGLPAAPVRQPPAAEDSAQGAAQVLQAYYALIDIGKYDDAWALWGEDGAASRMTADAFATSFDSYTEYHANIGAPGAIDAGASQRYVTVPVQVYGRMKAGGKPFYRIGSITLHRVGNVDGASAAQTKWRIRTADLKPFVR
jgi:hypothetical protein